MIANKNFIRAITSRNQHCSNCGKFGHLNRACKDPITSFGVICVRFEDPEMKLAFQEEVEKGQNINITVHNCHHNKYISSSHLYSDKIKFLLIRRRHSLGMLEFVRGRYDIKDYQGITKLFKLMSKDEIDLIRTNKDFRGIWDSIWTKTAPHIGKLSSYEDEYEASKGKFKTLQDGFREENVLGLSYYTNNVSPEWSTPEWGFPKGRRSYHEKNIDCATREFEEETGYASEDHHILKPVLPLKELLHGTNNIPYKHVYYLSVVSNTSKTPVVDDSNREIGDVGWFTYAEALNLFRPYHTEKRRLLNEVFKYAVSIIEMSKEGVHELRTNAMM